MGSNVRSVLAIPSAMSSPESYELKTKAGFGETKCNTYCIARSQSPSSLALRKHKNSADENCRLEPLSTQTTG
jgi:hypothetical protein